MCICLLSVIQAKDVFLQTKSMHLSMYRYCLKNMKQKLKDLIYQNVLINDTVVNANFMVSIKIP